MLCNSCTGLPVPWLNQSDINFVCMCMQSLGQDLCQRLGSQGLL